MLKSDSQFNINISAFVDWLQCKISACLIGVNDLKNKNI